MSIRVGHLSTFYHTATLLMAGDSASRALQTRIEWRLFGAGPAIVEAFGREELDLAYIGLPPAMIGIADRGMGIKCIAGGHVEGTVISGDKGLAAHPELETLKDVLTQLKGKTIGVPGRGSIHDVILADALEACGLAESVEVINFQWSDSIVEAMSKGEVSAAVGTPALAVAARRFAGGHILFPPSLLWPHNPSYGIVAAESFIREHRETAEKFLTLHEEASALLRSAPDEAAETIASVVGVVESDFVAETLAVSPRYCAQLSRQYISCTMRFSEALRRLGYISNKTLGEEDVFDLSLIRSTHPPGDHY